MSHASNTLREIIHRSFDGKKVNLAKKAGLTSEASTRLTQGQRSFTPATLESICQALDPDDARLLCASVCRDFLPEKYIHDIQVVDSTVVVADPVNPKSGPPLDAQSEQVLACLRNLAAKEDETKQWLHRLGEWIQP